MNAIQQKCRPKHQVLVLKCYPRTTKGAVDVKPNSSELSYLLFYAQSRRSKIQKVGSFLEKKTASDVYRQRIGNVQVTLQILTALIEKTPKDLPLFASCALHILEQILKSHDITMVESSIPTFEAFCTHHDPISLMGDQAYLRQYLNIVQQYASLASTRAFPGKLEPSKPIALRWRNTGLKAIRSIASSDALASATTQQYELAIPMILENLWTDNEGFLDVLHQRAEMEGGKVGGTALLKRRTSVATVQTAGSESNTNPIALADTAVDMDKLAEEDTGVLAMECLRQIFVAPNRSQVHTATVALLKFVQERVNQQEDVVRTDTNGRDSGWAVKMFLLVARWAPVADRFTILVTAMDTLAQQPLTDDTLGQHIVLAAMIGALLRSDINLIGLSVMDVLLQFVAHIRRLVQMPGDPNSMRSEGHLPGQPDPRTPTGAQFADKTERAAAQRKDLLFRLQECIGDLATHVYYADQISDMISTLLQRLKPSRSSSSTTGSPHRGDKSDGTPKSSAHALGAAADEHHVDSLFALTVAKTAALRAIKSVLLVANPRTKMSGNLGLSRSHVPVQVWDGTQWLLRDPDGLVRKAYVDAVVTWLDRETTPADARARDESAAAAAAAGRATLKNRELPGASLARRAVSSASAREKPTAPVKVPRSHFLQLLHLAVYDNAVQYLDYESDILVLHVLLAKLVDKLGVNAVRHGLPMIFRLQEDIQDAETPIHKVRLGSLVHGYFWVLTEKFDFETSSAVGRAIHNEIVRRRTKHFWVDGVGVPPPLLDLVGVPGSVRAQPRLPLKEIESEALLPLDERIALVECVCAAYGEQTVSPPQSPAASPGRTLSHPILGSTLSTIPPAVSGEAGEHEVPAHFREQMLGDWTREAVLASVQTMAAAAGSKSASLSGGSRSGTAGVNANHNHHRANGAGGGALAATTTANGQAVHRLSPHGSRTNLRPPGSAAGPEGARGARKAHSLRSAHSASPPSHAGSGVGGGREQQVVASVEQLKLVLSGQLQPPPPTTTSMAHHHVGGSGGPGFLVQRHDNDEDSSGDSLVSYDMTPSELSFNPAGGGGGGAVSTTAATSDLEAGNSHNNSHRMAALERKDSRAGGPLGLNPTSTSTAHDGGEEDEKRGGGGGEEESEMVPPVPPLPTGFTASSSSPSSSPPGQLRASPLPPSLPPVSSTTSGTGTLFPRPSTARRSVKSRKGGDGGGTDSRAVSAAGSWAAGQESEKAPVAVMDLQALLRGIEVHAGGEGMEEVARPPY